jgi:hypothetical protein
VTLGRQRTLKQLRRVGDRQIFEVNRNLGVLVSRVTGASLVMESRLAERSHVGDVRRVGHERLLDAINVWAKLVTNVLLKRGDDEHGRVRFGSRRRREELVRHAIVVRNSPAANLDPHIISPASRNDGEALAGELRLRRELLLNGAELFEGSQGVGRQQLRHDAVDGLERQPPAGQLDLPGRSDHIGFVAGVHHQRLAVDAHYRL